MKLCKCETRARQPGPLARLSQQLHALGSCVGPGAKQRVLEAKISGPTSPDDGGLSGWEGRGRQPLKLQESAQW